jgi:hypothetical protein
VPGKVFLALLLKIGFHRAGLIRYTGLKSSPYTEGAMFYGEKLVDQRAKEGIIAQAGQVAEPVTGPECAPGTA